MNFHMFYIHIGLHKTATTSLQHSVFPYIQGAYYLGRSSKGKESSSSLYTELSEYIHSKIIDLELEKELNEKLINFIDTNNQVILSDEWFTADYSGFYGLEGSRWQNKLYKISRIIKNIDHKILVTIREPVESIFSQYCEFQKINIQKKYPTFMSYALNSNDNLVFYYKEFDTYLGSLFDNITYLPFEFISNGKYVSNLSKFFNNKSIPEISKKYGSKRTNDSVLVNTDGKFRILFLSFIPKKIKIYLLNLHWIRRLKYWFFKKSINVITIKKPSSIERTNLALIYSESVLFYKAITNNEG